MTSSQLKRRAKIVDAVTALIAEAGIEAAQMRDVAQRSGVALGTVYKYFSSKEDLLAAALDSWQKRAARIIMGVGEPPAQDPVSGILDCLRRSQHAFQVDPEMTVLTMQLAISAEPTARVAIDQMLRTYGEIFSRLVEVVAPEHLAHVGFGLSAVLAGSLIGLLTGRMTLEESLSHVEWAARLMLSDGQPRTRKRSASLRARGEIDETKCRQSRVPAPAQVVH
ncbi:TetR/AcrR family transcriptional regulator [Mycobacterium malmoense]|uniref:TetR/AcrR family transcriptional regulator n=1 Tax=Mycobacterium malmoense TaxID=1780 RepID=UPI0008F88A64|nr:TetR/AcrR family transcriptional regulator [Mycobacterium malmoense]OIN81356.1 hypothetical protein BMG05_07755 [Mycobacterium malmoense]